MRKLFQSSMGSLDWVFSLAALIAICYALVRAIDLDESRWTNVASPLFSLASGLLFVVALRVQFKDHKHALSQMEQANRNHADMLLVAKYEKEFNTLTSAIGIAEAHIAKFEAVGLSGAPAMKGTIALWRENLSLAALTSYHNSAINDDLKLGKHESAMPGQYGIDSILNQLRWIDSAIENKELATEDREYLLTRSLAITSEVMSALRDVHQLQRDFEQWRSDRDYAYQTTELESGLSRCVIELESVVHSYEQAL